MRVQNLPLWVGRQQLNPVIPERMVTSILQFRDSENSRSKRAHFMLQLSLMLIMRHEIKLPFFPIHSTIEVHDCTLSTAAVETSYILNYSVHATLSHIDDTGGTLLYK